jgi:hypothetical protein
MSSHLPRNGRYELFSYLNKVHCFDDLDLEAIPASEEMFAWLRQQPADICKPMDDTNVAFYLTSEMYLIWKLKWT